MADVDLLGVVSLLLAAGGAAYLFRARVLGKRAEAEEITAPDTKKSAARDQQTLPPTLRPASDPPAPKPAKKTAPATPVAKAEEAKAEEVKAKAPVSSRGGAARGDKTKTLESKKTPDPVIKEAPISDQPPSTEPPSTKPEAASEPPQKPTIPIKDGPQNDRDPKMTPAPVTVPARKGPKFGKQTIVGIPAPANAPPKIQEAPPAPVAAKVEPLVPVIDIPRLDTDEDEDVEPTRVGRYERQSIRPPVEKHVFDEGADAKDAPTGKPLELRVFALAQTDPGRRRKQNEDSYLLRDKDGLFVVADGMGGHRGGEFASKCAVETMSEAFEQKKFDAEAHADLAPAASELARAIQMANAAILTMASQKAELKGMGTTLCAARFTEDNRRLYLGHVGDSRCYRVRDGVMKQMTSDHTMADYGVAGPEGSHLSRALGVWPTVPIDIIMATPQLGDAYLLCSDGLTKMLTNETIATQLMHEEDPKAAVERLVFFANAHGGKDNITVILLRVVEPGWKPPSEQEPKS